MKRPPAAEAAFPAENAASVTASIRTTTLARTREAELSGGVRAIHAAAINATSAATAAADACPVTSARASRDQSEIAVWAEKSTTKRPNAIQRLRYWWRMPA